MCWWLAELAVARCQGRGRGLALIAPTSDLSRLIPQTADRRPQATTAIAVAAKMLRQTATALWHGRHSFEILSIGCASSRLTRSQGGHEA